MRLSSKIVVLFFTLSFFALVSSVFSTEAIRFLSPAPQPASSPSANSPSNNDDSSSPSPSPLSSSPNAAPTPSADPPSPDAPPPSPVPVSQIYSSPAASTPASSPSPVPVSQISSSPGASPPSSTSLKSLPAYDDDDEDDESFPKASPLLSGIPSTSPSSLPWGLKDKDDVLQVLEIFIKQDIEFIEKQHQGLVKAQEDPKSFPDAASIPSTCIKHCSKDYATIIADFKKAEEDLLAKDFYFASEDITRVSSDLQACERCLNDMVKGECALKDINKKLKKHAAECLSALQFTS